MKKNKFYRSIIIVIVLLMFIPIGRTQSKFNKCDTMQNSAIDSSKVIFDFRQNKNSQGYTISIRDAVTDLPILAKIIISDSRTYNALYLASGFVFPDPERIRMHLKINAKGYFFKDVQINNRKSEEKSKVIYLHPLEVGQLIELESIKFEPQTSIFLPKAIPKLERLRDFMNTNPSVSIEVQGHVNLEGENTWKAKKLSKERAKSVKSYLIENGIIEDRISVKGFGNSKMKFPEPETEIQMEANRRVEILIK